MQTVRVPIQPQPLVGGIESRWRARPSRVVPFEGHFNIKYALGAADETSSVARLEFEAPSFFPDFGSPQAMSEAKSLAAFTRSAVDFDVAESDFLVLLDSRISNYESMAYRLPTSKDLEEYLRKTLRTRGAFKEPDGSISLYNKRSVEAWDDWI